MPEETPLAPSEGFADLKADILERGTVEPTKKRGRPSKAEVAARSARGEVAKTAKPAKEPRPDFLPVETVVEIVALPFDIYAGRKGDHWKLTEPEKKQIGALAAKVVNKHVPSWLDQWGDEIAFVTVLGTAIFTRYLSDITKAREEQKPIIPQFAADTRSPDLTRSGAYPLVDNL